MVYTTNVDGQILHLAVSGMLWRRSLVMVDKQTGTRWSHLLGKAMKGPLKGTRLQAIPCSMTTWSAWKREHPQTSVINLTKTSKRYTSEFYRRPGSFVFGWVHEGEQAYAAGLDVLLQQPLMNLMTEGAPVLLTFNPASTEANLFSRTIDKQTMTFERISESRMKDEATETVWNSQTGTALEGPLAGRQLKRLVGIMSYTRAWEIFHPENRMITEQVQ